MKGRGEMVKSSSCAAVLGLFVTLTACEPPPVPPETPPPPAPVEAPPPPPGPAPVIRNDGPHISRSVGVEGGAVVFWPRVIPASDDPELKRLAGELQNQLVAVTKEALVGKTVEARPEPERVCPREGCKAMTVGVLLAHLQGGKGCVAVALVSRPGESPIELVPWAGRVKLKRDEIPFREFPESEVTVSDAVPCVELVKSLGERKKEIAAAIVAAGS